MATGNLRSRVRQQALLATPLASRPHAVRKRIVFGVYALWPNFRSAAWTNFERPPYRIPDRLERPPYRLLSHGGPTTRKHELASVYNMKASSGSALNAWIQANSWEMYAANGWQNALMDAFSAGVIALRERGMG